MLKQFRKLKKKKKKKTRTDSEFLLEKTSHTQLLCEIGSDKWDISPRRRKDRLLPLEIYENHPTVALLLRGCRKMQINFFSMEKINYDNRSSHCGIFHHVNNVYMCRVFLSISTTIWLQNVNLLHIWRSFPAPNLIMFSLLYRWLFHQQIKIPYQKIKVITEVMWNMSPFLW